MKFKPGDRVVVKKIDAEFTSNEMSLPVYNGLIGKVGEIISIDSEIEPAYPIAVKIGSLSTKFFNESELEFEEAEPIHVPKYNPLKSKYIF